MNRDGKSESMKKRAAVRRYTVWMLFPVAGDYAFMVSETRGRSYAGELLLQWLTRSLQRESVTVDADGKKHESEWLNWKLEPRIDGDRLERILSESSDHTIRLRRHSISATGGRPTYDLELVQLGLKKTPIDKVADAISAMRQRSGKGTQYDRRQQAAQEIGRASCRERVCQYV